MAVCLNRPNDTAAYHSDWQAVLAGTAQAAADIAAAGQGWDTLAAADPDMPGRQAIVGPDRVRTVQPQAVYMAVALDSAGLPDTVLAPGMAADIVVGWLLLAQPCLLHAIDALQFAARRKTIRRRPDQQAGGQYLRPSYCHRSRSGFAEIREK